MSWRPSRGTKLHRQECINEGNEEDECPDRGYDQCQTGREAESGSSFNASGGRPDKGKLRTTGPVQTVQFSPGEDQPCKLASAGGYQGGGKCSPRDTSRGERFQPFEVCPDYQSVQYIPNDEPLQCPRGNARPVSPHQKSCPEGNDYNIMSFHEQGGEYMAECEEGSPTRAFSPQFSPDQCRQPMTPQNRRFVDDISTPCGTRFQVPSDNTSMNASPRSFRQQESEDMSEFEASKLPRGRFDPDEYRVSLSTQNRQFIDDISTPCGTRFQELSDMNASPRSFRQQESEDMSEFEASKLPRGRFDPDEYRVSLSTQNRQFIDDISTPCGTRFQELSDNSSMNASPRSFRQQRGKDISECAERPPPRAASPQFSPVQCRQPMTPQNRQFVDDISSLYRTRFQVPCDMNATSSTISFFHDSTIYNEIPPFIHNRSNQSDSRGGSPLKPDNMECQNFSPNGRENQYFSPGTLKQRNFSPDGLELRNFSPDCPEAQNFSPDCPEPQNTSGSPGGQISPDYMGVPQNSPTMKHCYPHRASLRTPESPRTPLRTPGSPRTQLRTPGSPKTPFRTPEPYGGEECRSGGSTFRKPGPEYLTLENSGPCATPSPAASSAPSYGKFNLSSPSQRSGRGASPPITCVGGSPKDNKREALENLAQLTGTKSGKRCPGGSPKDNKREALENLAQLTMTKPGKPCPRGSPKQGVANFSQATVTKPGGPCPGGSPKVGAANFSQATVAKPGKPCPGGSPKGGMVNFSQATVTKPGKPCPGVTPQGGNREALDHLSQLTATRPGKPCIGVTPQGGNRESLAPCNIGTVTKSVPPRCKRALSFGQAVDISTCDQSGSTPRRLPRKPELSQDEIKELIDSESEDVEYAWLLSSEKKQTYKKPCPKQQKAQMSVKQMVETAQKPKGDPCAKEYPPLLEPDPEDLSPEVAAAMMFSQEQGIKLDSCPDQTIRHLFPSESLTKKTPPSKISIVDPNQKDQEELIEKSAYVPSEGVSDSAYTRTMKQKGGDEIPSQKSYDLDFALGQEKREVVLVPQRPKRFNTVQFRGNVTPWFPGYFSAFPDQSDSITIVPSPSKLFLKAWIMTNPANVKASDIIVID